LISASLLLEEQVLVEEGCSVVGWEEGEEGCSARLPRLQEEEEEVVCLAPFLLLQPLLLLGRAAVAAVSAQ
jgi:hypothetical protein